VDGGFVSEKYADRLGVSLWLCGSQSRNTSHEMSLPNLNQHSALLFQIWEDSYQRVATQQEIYEGPWQRCSLLICMGAGEGPVSH
jgi:hypothetical protein